MRITVNGAPENVPASCTLAALVGARSLPRNGVAVALDGEVVRAQDWAETELRPDAAVEIVTARQGG